MALVSEAHLLFMMFIVFIFGTFIDWIGILMIWIPILMPLATSRGFNELWFARTIAVNLQASFLTPPFGYAIFHTRATLPDYVTLADLYRGVIPFVILMPIGLGVCIIFPKLITLVPSKMIT